MFCFPDDAQTEAQQDLLKMDVLVCGDCRSIYHFVEEFSDHKRKCTGIKQSSPIEKVCTGTSHLRFVLKTLFPARSEDELGLFAMEVVPAQPFLAECMETVPGLGRVGGETARCLDHGRSIPPIDFPPRHWRRPRDDGESDAHNYGRRPQVGSQHSDPSDFQPEFECGQSVRSRCSQGCRKCEECKYIIDLVFADN